MKKVKILKCSNDKLWYNDKIGENYTIRFTDDNGDIVVDLENESGQLGSILSSDIEIIN